MIGIPRLYEVLEGRHTAFADRLRRLLEEDDRAGLEAWLHVTADPERPLFAQVLVDGPIRRALRTRVVTECLREVFVAPNRLFDERLRDEAGDHPKVKRLLEDPTLPFYLRAPGETAGRLAGAARGEAAGALDGAEDLEDFLAVLREGDGEVLLAAL